MDILNIKVGSTSRVQLDEDKWFETKFKAWRSGGGLGSYYSDVCFTFVQC